MEFPIATWDVITLIYSFCNHDGTPYWWDVMTYCLSWWNSLRGCHDHDPGCSFFQFMVEILCGDVRLLQFLSEDTNSNEQYKLQRKTKCIPFIHSMDWMDIYDAVFRQTLLVHFHYEQCKVRYLLNFKSLLFNVNYFSNALYMQVLIYITFFYNGPLYIHVYRS